MFFTLLIAVPLIAGAIAGLFGAQRVVPWVLSAACVGLGVAGTIAAAFNEDGRASTMTFSIAAGVVCASLVWIAYGLARVGARVVRHTT